MNVTNQPPDGGPVSVRVWGDFACFTRPEFGVERVSYPVMTPTAAVGVLDAIFWKPEFRWRIVAIDVLRPVRWIQVRRNEITTRQTIRTAKAWASGDDEGYDAASPKHRAQRAGLLLAAVAYVIYAHPDVRPGVDSPSAKYRDQLRRRVRRGQYHEHPYLGCREFPCDFSDPDPAEPRLAWDEHLGPVIHSVYAGPDDPRTAATASPIFFDAQVQAGRMIVPRLPGGRR
ncbi:MAG: type I-C CRISPR-associated protein Cas5c [Acidimicrobiales bacterium]